MKKSIILLIALTVVYFSSCKKKSSDAAPPVVGTGSLSLDSTKKIMARGNWVLYNDHATYYDTKGNILTDQSVIAGGYGVSFTFDGYFGAHQSNTSLGVYDGSLHILSISAASNVTTLLINRNADLAVNSTARKWTLEQISSSGLTFSSTDVTNLNYTIGNINYVAASAKEVITLIK